jgi:hypothetical protein
VRSVDTAEYSIFVNSTDSFQDTWEPFFHLLHDYWPEAGPVILNTERASFSHPDLEVTATRVARDGEGAIPWGECMIRALDSIPTEMFVYLQDDYFLYDHVKLDVVDEAVRIMAAEQLDCLRLMECGGAGPWSDTAYPWLWSVSQHAQYRISLQAALWTKTAIRKYLRRHESPWQLEHWGSKRAARMDGKIWAVSRDVYGDGMPQVVPYRPTGIVKGQWERDIVEPLFAEHGIEVDYRKRGFMGPEGPRRSTLGQKIAKAPKYAWDMLRSR